MAMMDSEGHSYGSLRELWRRELDGEEGRKGWYQRAASHWQASLDGVLGGHAETNGPDLRESRRFLETTCCGDLETSAATVWRTAWTSGLASAGGGRGGPAARAAPAAPGGAERPSPRGGTAAGAAPARAGPGPVRFTACGLEQLQLDRAKWELCEWIRSSLAVGAKQERVDMVAEHWASDVWTHQQTEETTPTRLIFLPLASPGLRRRRGAAAEAFSKSVGLGADQFNPRQLEYVSDGLLDVIISLCTAAEALHNEASRAQQLEIGCALEFWMAYEVVSLATAQDCALGTGYPEQMVQAALRVYAVPRLIVIDGAATSDCYELASVLIAGRSLAGIIPRCAMMVLDAEHRRCWKEVHVAITFEGCSPRMAGSFWDAAHYLGGAARDFIHGLEADMGCAVSRPKSEALASSGGLRDTLVDVMNRGGSSRPRKQAAEQSYRVAQARGARVPSARRQATSGSPQVTEVGREAMAWSDSRMQRWRAGAAPPTRRGLGWHMTSAKLVRDDLDRAAGLMEVGHHAIEGFVELGPTKAPWREMAGHRSELEAVRRGGAIASARCQFLTNKASARVAARSCLARNAMVGCSWPVARRAGASPPLAPSARSAWCCEEVGTVRHLARRCPALGGPRCLWLGESPGFAALQEAEAATASNGEELLLWSRGPLTDQRSEAPQPFPAIVIRRAGSHPGDVSARDAFPDGSAARARDCQLARSGWAAVTTWANDAKRAAARGNAPRPLPRGSGAGELQAAAVGFPHCVGYDRGGGDAGDAPAQAHCAEHDVREERISDRQRAGNARADGRAQEGASLRAAPKERLEPIDTADHLALEPTSRPPSLAPQPPPPPTAWSAGAAAADARARAWRRAGCCACRGEAAGGGGQAAAAPPRPRPPRWGADIHDAHVLYVERPRALCNARGCGAASARATGLTQLRLHRATSDRQAGALRRLRRGLRPTKPGKLGGGPRGGGIYHSGPSFAILAAAVVCYTEGAGLARFTYTGAVLGCVAASTLTTGVVVLSGFWLVKLAGALAMKVVTQARSIGLILCSVFFFGEFCTGPQYLGYTITLIGMGLFDNAKQMLKNAACGDEAKVPGGSGMVELHSHTAADHFLDGLLLELKSSVPNETGLLQSGLKVTTPSEQQKKDKELINHLQLAPEEVDRLNDVIEKRGIAKANKDIKDMKDTLQLFRKSHAEMKPQLKEQLTEEVQEKLAETTHDLDSMKLQMNASHARVDQANDEMKEMVLQPDKENMKDMQKQLQFFAGGQAEMQLKLMEQFTKAQLKMANVGEKDLDNARLQMEYCSSRLDKADVETKEMMLKLQTATKDTKEIKEKFQLLQDGQAAMKVQLKEQPTHEMQEKLAKYKPVVLERTQPLSETALLRGLANTSGGTKQTAAPAPFGRQVNHSCLGSIPPACRLRAGVERTHSVTEVLLYLPDDDLTALLGRCREALRTGGLLCVKENVVLEGRWHVDKTDNSIARTDAHYKEIFARANLDVVREARQTCWPDDVIPVKMYALRPAQGDSRVRRAATDRGAPPTSRRAPAKRPASSAPARAAPAKRPAARRLPHQRAMRRPAGAVR
ncbi:unnamed protein product [Prorocentrum cordatum]|uniref:Alpha N-terminal protein methyltransferase 1 n=1 Tax=Prorocentrum cordatum TaxID=2364126 RepID=A0ABN9SXE6_9DINO|nr:unnamed protein product [Polarella glacialis]